MPYPNRTSRNRKNRIFDFIYYRTIYIVYNFLIDLKDYYYMYFKHDYFMFNGDCIPYFYHPYNHTRLNERQVEIPVFEKIIDGYSDADILEIGNVLPHYINAHHTVVDKYETGPGVINADATTYHPEKKFKCVISISTFEHIGYNYGETNEPAKIRKTIEHIFGMVEPGGIFAMSGTVGYNPVFDQVIREAGLFDQKYYYKRINGRWVCVPEDRLDYICDLYTRDDMTREVFIGIKYAR